MLDRDEEVLVQAVGLLALELVAERLLLLEPGALVDRVVELGKGVAYLAAGDEALEPLHEPRVVRPSLGQRRHLHGVVHQERGLDKLGLDPG